jgi:hypothetical protein
MNRVFPLPAPRHLHHPRLRRSDATKKLKSENFEILKFQNSSASALPHPPFLIFKFQLFSILP